MVKRTRGNRAKSSTRGSARGAAPRQSGAQSPSRRKFVVFTSLVGALTGTSALLLALAPASLTPDAARSLLAVNAPQSLDVIFDTPIPLQDGRWKSIFIHHSRTPSGSATTLAAQASGLADHFVICNGIGGGDGELQISQRWTQQSPPGLTPGLERIDQDCISICLIGDFNRLAPTAAQQQRLSNLVSALQHRLVIPADDVTVVQQTPEAAGIGSRFPVVTLRSHLLR
jgi:hypothetical protein